MISLPEGLLPLERTVLRLLLNRPGEPFTTAAAQLAHAVTAERKLTGVGFFRHFNLPTTAPVPRTLLDSTLGDVHGAHPELRAGAGFLLFVRHGVVAWLEGFTYADEWPQDEERFTFTDAAGHLVT